MLRYDGPSARDMTARAETRRRVLIQREDLPVRIGKAQRTARIAVAGRGCSGSAAVHHTFQIAAASLGSAISRSGTNSSGWSRFTSSTGEKIPSFILM